MSAVNTTNPGEGSLLHALNGMSRWPEHPFRHWAKPGCRFSMVECSQYEAISEPSLRYCELEARDVAPKLRANAKNNNSTPSTGGIKFLILEGSTDPLDPAMDSVDFGDEHRAIEQAFEVFGLSASSKALLSLEINCPTSSELLEIGSQQGQRSPTKFLDFPYHALLWTHDPENTIYAILRADLVGMRTAEYLASLIDQHKSFLTTPLLLPYLACYLAINYNGDMMRDILAKLRTLESRLGFHDWNNTENSLQKSQLAAEELSGSSRMASGIAAAACSRKTDANAISRGVQSLIDVYQRDPPIVTPQCKGNHGLWTEMYQSLKILDGILTSQSLFAEEIHQRALIQQSAIFHLTAQREQALNLEVAKNSQIIAVQAKHDTVSMETIAFLSMLILPAGFTATLFAMPIFDWTSSNPLSRHFWIYIAVATPITILTFLVWWIWSKWKLKRTIFTDRKEYV